MLSLQSVVYPPSFGQYEKALSDSTRMLTWNFNRAHTLYWWW